MIIVVQKVMDPMSITGSYGRSPNVSSYGSSSFDVLDSGEIMGGELAPESYGIFYFL